MVRRGEAEAVVSRFSLYSLELLMIRGGKREELKTFLSTLSTFKGLSILSTKIIDDLRILDIMERFNLDFDDALNYHIVRRFGLEGIISFDRDFDKTDIRRVEPRELINPI